MATKKKKRTAPRKKRKAVLAAKKGWETRRRKARALARKKAAARKPTRKIIRQPVRKTSRKPVRTKKRPRPKKRRPIPVEEPSPYPMGEWEGDVPETPRERKLRIRAEKAEALLEKHGIKRKKKKPETFEEAMEKVYRAGVLNYQLFEEISKRFGRPLHDVYNVFFGYPPSVGVKMSA